MGLEGSAFEALERDFQEVLQVWKLEFDLPFGNLFTIFVTGLGGR